VAVPREVGGYDLNWHLPVLVYRPPRLLILCFWEHDKALSCGFHLMRKHNLELTFSIRFPIIVQRSAAFLSRSGSGFLALRFNGDLI
jgi:hypothetical protein